MKLDTFEGKTILEWKALAVKKDAIIDSKCKERTFANWLVKTAIVHGEVKSIKEDAEKFTITAYSPHVNAESNFEVALQKQPLYLKHMIDEFYLDPSRNSKYDRLLTFAYSGDIAIVSIRGLSIDNFCLEVEDITTLCKGVKLTEQQKAGLTKLTLAGNGIARAIAKAVEVRL